MENIISYKAEKSSHKPLLTQLKEIHRGSYSLPSISPSHFLEVFFFYIFLFSGETFFFLLSARKTVIPLGPILPRRIEPILKCERCQPKHRLRLPAPLAGRRKTASANHIREGLFRGTNDHFLLLRLYSQE